MTYGCWILTFGPGDSYDHMGKVQVCNENLLFGLFLKIAPV